MTLSPRPSPADAADEAADLEPAVRVFRALGDPTRYRIVRLLVDRGEMGCSELLAHLPLSAPCLSHHTRILQACGLIGLRKDGAFHFFHARMPTVERYAPTLLNAER